MRTVLSLFKGKNVCRILPLLVVVLVTGSIGPSPVSAEAGYTQGWMGAPDWAVAWMNENGEAKLPEFFYPEDINVTKVEEPDPASYVAYGNSLLEAGSFAEAKQNFETAIGLAPDSFDAWLGRGYALEGLNRTQTALDSYEKAIGFSNVSDYDWAAFAGKGRALLVLQRNADAVGAFRSAGAALESQKTGTSEEQISVYLGLAEAAQKSGDLEESSAALRKAESLRSQFDLNSTA